MRLAATTAFLAFNLPYVIWPLRHLCWLLTGDGLNWLI